ncbi:gastrokine-1-like [Rhineura floridana]|uniref:gastrokine-1-like n=1 Tax=Rhineura floridana TaxID=261503 RepID=UPI002AC82FF7|nr:gastrokine-1-like [Rhineura floridana]
MKTQAVIERSPRRKTVATGEEESQEESQQKQREKARAPRRPQEAQATATGEESSNKRPKILTASLLGLLMNSAFASNAIQLINKGNDGGTVYQTVNINHNTNVATFNIYSGLHSTNAIVDYNSGVVVYHMPYKRVCVVSKMNLETFPSISQLDNMVHEGQPPLHSLYRSYGVSRRLVTNVADFGGPIQAICEGLTTYWATEFQRPHPLVGGRGCAELNLLILDVSLCGDTSLF